MRTLIIYALILGALAHGAASIATPAIAGNTLRIEAALNAAGV